jgi:hypothetical protein
MGLRIIIGLMIIIEIGGIMSRIKEFLMSAIDYVKDEDIYYRKGRYKCIVDKITTGKSEKKLRNNLTRCGKSGILNVGLEPK